jgi:hypothetical protein
MQLSLYHEVFTKAEVQDQVVEPVGDLVLTKAVVILILLTLTLVTKKLVGQKKKPASSFNTSTV